MKIAGLGMNDVWAHRVLRERGVEVERVDDVEADVDVLVESAELAHHGPEQKYRPYLHLTGELRAVRPHEALAHGIKELDFTAGGESVDAYYEFDDQQLTALAAKGYFNADFDVPEEITGIEWELPSRIDALVIAPEGDQDVPLAFVRVHDLGSLDVDLDTSGYDLAEYFADRSRDGVEHAEPAIQEKAARHRSDSIDPLFEQEEIEIGPEQRDEAERQEAAEADAAVRGSVEERLRDVEADLEQRREAARAERESTEGTAENLYHQRVAERLRESQEAETVEVQHEDLDLLGEDEVEEIGVEPVRTAPDRLEATKRRVERRAAELDGQNGPETDRQL